jgi:hypothetical protein
MRAGPLVLVQDAFYGDPAIREAVLDAADYAGLAECQGVGMPQGQEDRAGKAGNARTGRGGE